ncbi:MAG: hypothetical protein ABSH16_03045 [Sedimentisphaerales bacterium]
MSINEKKPEDVLKPEFIQKYKELHEDIWHRLVETNTTITILEKIQNFPFQHIYAPGENIFWTTVSWDFLHIVIVFLHALVKDQGKNAHTLNVFKNKIVKWLKDSEKEAYFKKIEDAKFSQSTKAVLDKITNMRHQLLAHRLLDENGYLLNPGGIVVSEIRSAYDDVEKLFNMCSFGARYVCNFYTNDTVGGKPIEKDIDQLLDLIVKDSYWLNQPERYPMRWQCAKDARTKPEIAELNKWRQKFGLPSV